MSRIKSLRNRGVSHGARHGSPFKKGDLKYVILDLIKEKPRYGYEIIGALTERSYGFYAPSPGVIYPTLQALDEMDYVTASDRDGKKVYTISEEGLKFLEERKDLTDKVKDHMKHHWSPESIGELKEMMVNVYEIERMIKQQVRYEDNEKIQKITGVVSRARSEIGSILQENPNPK